MSAKKMKEVFYEYRHYFIASSCVLLLALVLLLTMVFPLYYQYAKLRFMDKNTNSPIVNTKFVIYKYNDADFQSLAPMILVKTDAQGYVRLNTGHIKGKRFFVKNEDYYGGIDINRTSCFLVKNTLKHRVAKDIKAFGEVLDNAGNLKEFKEQMKKQKLEVNYKPSYPDIK